VPDRADVDPPAGIEMSPPPRPRPVSMVLLEEGVPKSALLAYVSRYSISLK